MIRNRLWKLDRRQLQIGTSESASNRINYIVLMFYVYFSVDFSNFVTAIIYIDSSLLYTC